MLGLDLLGARHGGRGGHRGRGRGLRRGGPWGWFGYNVFVDTDEDVDNSDLDARAARIEQQLTRPVDSGRPPKGRSRPIVVGAFKAAKATCWLLALGAVGVVGAFVYRVKRHGS